MSQKVRLRGHSEVGAESQGEEAEQEAHAAHQPKRPPRLREAGAGRISASEDANHLAAGKKFSGAH